MSGMTHFSSIEFVNAYVLLNRNERADTAAARDRLSYVIDHSNPTPGKKPHPFHSLTLTSVSGYVSREQGEHLFNHLNRYYT